MSAFHKVLSTSASGGAKLYVEDVFSTYLYTGNGSTQTITNGIDLAGEGGLVWTKQRDAAINNVLIDSARGVSGGGIYKPLFSNLTNAENTAPSYGVSAFNNNGYTIGSSSAGSIYNNNGSTYVSWTFRKAPKFFDVVTYTGNGVAGRTVAHSLGSVPGCIIIKRTDSTSDWGVMSRQDGGAPDTYYTGLKLNTTNANTGVFTFVSSNTSTTFSINVDPVGGSTSFNTNGAQYVAYLFAHNAGGFGDDGLQDIISCGSITTDASTPSVFNNKVTLGWEPQYILLKNADSAGDWLEIDVMRGIAEGTNTYALNPNTSAAENNWGDNFRVESDGFNFKLNIFGYSKNIIYIAIRRPMKTPTSGSEVFDLNFYSNPADGVAPMFKSNMLVDAALRDYRPGGIAAYPYFASRLTGITYLTTSSTAAEATSTPTKFDYMTGWGSNAASTTDTNNLSWMFKRAPGFFDVVCATSDGSGVISSNHNLGVTPELIIVKRRDSTSDWTVYGTSTILNSGEYLILNSNVAKAVGGSGQSFSSTTFSLPYFFTNSNYIVYLFATTTGVSSLGSFSGNSSTKTINCGFANGARFVLIKCKSHTGDWFIWDTARGIVSGNDPYLLLNSTAAEVTTTDGIDPNSSGFTVDYVGSGYNINQSGKQYIYLAIA